MNLKQLFADEDAVSPVIGVILMVAITVILAAVIGTFVLGLGENVQDSAPQANFQFEYDIGGTTPVTITHTGGEDIQESEVSIEGAGITVSSPADFGADADDVISTGQSLEISQSPNPGETIRVIWTSPSGGTSNTIGQSTVPN